VRITNRYDSFRGTSKERTAKKFGVTGVNVFARKSATGVRTGERAGSAKSEPSAKGGDKAAMAAVAGGLVATIATAAACVGPLVAILMGVGGLGWLTQYAYLRVPASLATAGLLAFGFYWVYRKPKTEDCAQKQSSKKSLIAGLLWTATALAVAVNVFEYVIFPNL
jgi:mercuric ion transport protein